jgi:uncharacterized membrane protein required for colicin V production
MFFLLFLALRGNKNGLISEVFSLIGWLCSLALFVPINSLRFNSSILEFFSQFAMYSNKSKYLMSGAILLTCAMISHLLFRCIRKSQAFAKLNRTAGMVFGLAKGLLLLLVLVVVYKKMNIDHLAVNESIVFKMASKFLLNNDSDSLLYIDTLIKYFKHLT